MSGFNFGDVEEWKVSTGVILGKGNYVCTIADATKEESKGGWPQITLKLEAAEGEITDWMTLPETAAGKVLSLARASGLPSDPDTLNQHVTVRQCKDGVGIEMSDEWVKSLIGRKVGVVVREEPQQNDPRKTRSRVQGYVTTDQIKPIPGQGQSSGQTTHEPTKVGGFEFPSALSNTKNDDDIPF